MLMYVFDRRWHTKLNKDGAHEKIKNKLGGPIDTVTAAPHAKDVVVSEFLVDQTHSIATIGAFIYKHAKTDKIDVLYLCGHGNAGYLEMGTGLDISSVGQLKSLHDHKVFAKGAVVELHGCDIASGVANQSKWIENGLGHKLMKSLAHVLDATVKAGIEEQTGNIQFQFIGTVVTVGPNGKTTVTKTA